MTNGNSEDRLPVHDQLSWLTRGIELSCILSAIGLIVAQLVRLFDSGVFWFWWTPLCAAAGLLTADFVSGLVHWTADTWGSETMPILGRRFVRPFRVHHVNPHDFLRRDVIDTNGDVAGIVTVFLVALYWVPLQSTGGRMAAVWMLAFCIGGLPTNQVHQWAHMPRPPRPVRRLQQMGILLSRSAHRRHHVSPYVVNYCIATGWCNPFLSRVRFFPRLERTVSILTGLRPRADDQAFAGNVWQSRPLSAPVPSPDRVSSTGGTSHG